MPHAGSAFGEALVRWGVRAWIMALAIGAGVTTVLAMGSAAAPAQAMDDVLQCIECEEEACRPVQAPAAREGRCTPDGCVPWGECG